MRKRVSEFLADDRFLPAGVGEATAGGEGEIPDPAQVE
jgi:hypothetical protein